MVFHGQKPMAPWSFLMLTFIRGHYEILQPGAAEPHGWRPGNGAATDGKSGAAGN